MKPIWRVFGYLKLFPKELTLYLLSIIFYIFFNLFSYVLVIPFVELLFGMSVPPAVEPALAFNQEALTEWIIFHLYRLRDLYGLWPCLFTVSGLYLLLVLLSNFFRYMVFFWMDPIRFGVVRHLRDDIYHKITILPISFFTAQRRGDIISRMSNDIADIEWCVNTTLTALVKSPVNILVFCITLVFINAKLFLFFLLIVPLAVWAISSIGKRLKHNAIKGQNKLGTLFALLEESLGGVRTIRSYNQEAHHQERFRKANEDYTRTNIKVAMERELGSPLSETMGTIALAAIMILGGTFVIKGSLAPSVFIFFVIIFVRLIPPIQSLITAYNHLQKSNAAAIRFFTLLDSDEQITQKPDAVVLQGFENSLECRDLCFAYTSEDAEGKKTQVPVLDHINLTIPKGKTVAIVGPSGAGKTTLADLLPRFYDCTEGAIVIDGQDIRDLDINSLRKVFGLVSQNCILFHDTVANNIAFGRQDYSTEHVRQAAQAAYADEFIEHLPQGYDTIIGDRGMTLSGGQCQRLSIARAILKDPPILILDEATSALDAESEQAVQKALNQLMKGRTAIVIAHRLSTIQNADEIIVLDHGKIVEQGTHSQLIENNGLYQKLVTMQRFT